MTPSDSDRQGFIELTNVVKALKLTAGQRIKLASLVAADKSLGGLRSDGTLPIGVALKLAHAAKNR